MKRIICRRQASDWLKTIALVIFFWWLIIYGFSGESTSNFGEHLDRINIEHEPIQKQLREESSEEKTISLHDQTTLDPKSAFIFNAFLNKLSATEKVKVPEVLLASTKSTKEVTNFTIKITKELLQEKLSHKQEDEKEDVVLGMLTKSESGE